MQCILAFEGRIRQKEIVNSEVKPEPLDDDIEEFLPS